MLEANQVSHATFGRKRSRESSSTSDIYAHKPSAQIWTETELQILRSGLERYPAGVTSTGNLERYIKIASELEHKSVRDVAFKASEVMRAQATMTKLQHNTEPPQFKVKDVEINSMLQTNVQLLTDMRENLLQARLKDNLQLMIDFRGNCSQILDMLKPLKLQMPPLTVKMNDALLGFSVSDNPIA